MQRSLRNEKYWAYKAIPQLGKLPPSERRRIVEDAYDRLMWRPRTLLLLALLWFVPAVVGVLLSLLLAVNLRSTFLCVCSAIGGLFGGGVLALRYEMSLLLPLIRAELGGVCAACGYSLSGNTSGRCPECGTPIPRSGVVPKSVTPPVVGAERAGLVLFALLTLGGILLIAYGGPTLTAIGIAMTAMCLCGIIICASEWSNNRVRFETQLSSEMKTGRSHERSNSEV